MWPVINIAWPQTNSFFHVNSDQISVNGNFSNVENQFNFVFNSKYNQILVGNLELVGVLAGLLLANGVVKSALPPVPKGHRILRLAAKCQPPFAD